MSKLTEIQEYKRTPVSSVSLHFENGDIINIDFKQGMNYKETAEALETAADKLHTLHHKSGEAGGSNSSYIQG